MSGCQPVTRSGQRLAPLETLYQSRRGRQLPLPPRLLRLYGSLRMPRHGGRPHVISNFVSTLDGVVSFNVPGCASGGPISGFSAQDRMVMGLLRAIADVVVVGAGTLGVDHRHVWTAERIFPQLSDEYRQLRSAMGIDRPPLNVVVTGSGRIELDAPMFASGEVSSLIVTTPEGARRIARRPVPDGVEIRAVRGGKSGVISAKSIIRQVCRATAANLILVEGGPRLLGKFHQERLVDEQFLVAAPQIAGRIRDDGRLGLVMGRTFGPASPRWGILSDVRRAGSLLFLRYSFA